MEGEHKGFMEKFVGMGFATFLFEGTNFVEG